MCCRVWEEITIPTYATHARYGIKGGQPNPPFLDVGAFIDLVLTPYREARFQPHAGPFLFEFQRHGMFPSEFPPHLPSLLLQSLPPSHFPTPPHHTLSQPPPNPLPSPPSLPPLSPPPSPSSPHTPPLTTPPLKHITLPFHDPTCPQPPGGGRAPPPPELPLCGVGQTSLPAEYVRSPLASHILHPPLINLSTPKCRRIAGSLYGSKDRGHGSLVTNGCSSTAEPACPG